MNNDGCACANRFLEAYHKYAGEWVRFVFGDENVNGAKVSPLWDPPLTLAIACPSPCAKIEALLDRHFPCGKPTIEYNIAVLCDEKDGR